MKIELNDDAAAAIMVVALIAFLIVLAFLGK